MNVMIIGDDPSIVGGVTNYTRPLAKGLNLAGTKVHYLYSVAMNMKYDFGKMRIETSEEEGISYHRLVNGKALLFNYDNLDVDTGDWFDTEFDRLVSENQINLIHINEIFGFSSHLIKIAKARGIRVITSVHEYWWLCPHRVMVDYDRAVCEGPSNIDKCTHCVIDRASDYNSKRERLKYQLRTQFSGPYKMVADFVKSRRKNHYASVDLSPPKHSAIIAKDTGLREQLQNRLKLNIEMLNLCDQVICVSSDVKRILSQYGVDEHRCVIDHIGSVIADKEWTVRDDWKPSERISFGFIGGLSYYKGVHLITQAYMALTPEEKKLATVDIYGAGDTGYMQSMTRQIEEQGDDLDKANIKFHGRYKPDELDAIGNSIDISILPSMCADTAPQTIFESYSAGLPIIAPNIGGFQDFIEHNHNGLIFEYGNVDSLKESIRALISNPEKIAGFCREVKRTKGMKQHIADINSRYRSLVENS